MDRKETENQDRFGSPDEAFETAVTMVGGENDAPPAEAADQSAPAESEKAESPAEATATESEKAEPAAEEEPASTGVTAVTVSLEDKQAVVTSAPTVTKDALCQAVQAAGYQATA